MANKNTTFTFRVSPEEKKEIDARAKAANMTTTEYFKTKMLSPDPSETSEEKIEEAAETLAEQIVRERLPELEENETIMKELEEARRKFDSELGFLQEERKRTADFYDKYFGSMEKRQSSMEEACRKTAEAKAQLEVIEKEKEISKITAEFNACKEELERLKKLSPNEPAESKPSEVQEPEKASSSVLPEEEKKTSAKGVFGKRKDMKRASLLVDAISDKNRSPEQFDVIADAFKKGLSLKGLNTLLKADVPLENLKLLEMVLLRKELGDDALKEYK